MQEMDNSALSEFKKRKRKSTVIAIISAVIVIVLVDSVIFFSGGFHFNINFNSTQSEQSNNQGDASDGSIFGDQARDFAAYYAQEVDWEPCDDPTFYCAEIQAPLKWGEPAKEIAPKFDATVNTYDNDAQASITLKIERAKSAKDVSKYLFTNPGGPGAGGTSFLESAVDSFSKDLRSNFILASWDPRGVEGSTAIKCYKSDAEKLADIYTDIPGAMPDNIEETKQSAEKTAQGCKDLSGSLLKYVDTQSSARDMELIRAVLKQDTLNYIGFSYGTKLGAEYVGMFPKSTGGIVLDGADYPKFSMDEEAEAQAKGFQIALDAYLTDCIANNPLCPFAGQTVEYGNKWIKASIDKLHRSPIKLDDGRELNETMFTYGLLTPLYSQDSWTYLTLGLASLKKLASPKILEHLSDSYFEYENGTFASNETEAISAIQCLDHNDGFDLETAKIEAEKLRTLSPTLGDSLSWNGLGCTYFPKASNQVEYDDSAPDSAPVLVVGTTRDPATPYENAELMTKMFKNGILLGYDADGHTAYLHGSDALKSAIDNFLITGKAPESGAIIK